MPAVDSDAESIEWPDSDIDDGAKGLVGDDTIYKSRSSSAIKQPPRTPTTRKRAKASSNTPAATATDEPVDEPPVTPKQNAKPKRLTRKPLTPAVVPDDTDDSDIEIIAQDRGKDGLDDRSAVASRSVPVKVSEEPGKRAAARNASPVKRTRVQRSDSEDSIDMNASPVKKTKHVAPRPEDSGTVDDVMDVDEEEDFEIPARLVLSETDIRLPTPKDNSGDYDVPKLDAPFKHTALGKKKKNTTIDSEDDVDDTCSKDTFSATPLSSPSKPACQQKTPAKKAKGSIRFLVRTLPAAAAALNTKDDEDPVLSGLNYYQDLPLVKSASCVLITTYKKAGPGWPLRNFSSWQDKTPSLIVESAAKCLAFQQDDEFINLSRVSPLKLFGRSVPDSSPPTFEVCVQVDGVLRTAICLTCVAITESSTVDMHEKLEAYSISGLPHNVEWPRLVGALSMLTGNKTVAFRMYKNAVNFFSQHFTNTSDTTNAQEDANDPMITHPLLQKQIIPIYDGRGNAWRWGAKFFRRINKRDTYVGEISMGSFALVAYVTQFHHDPDRTKVYFSPLWAMVLAEPE